MLAGCGLALIENFIVIRRKKLLKVIVPERLFLCKSKEKAMKPPDKKTTCESKGHFWQSTASTVYRHCGRTGCKATQHLINGRWIETQPTQPKPAAQPGAQQADLWA